jgi:O-acetyl-ADP-ribose deacetylase (regulator of RNase III)
LQGVRFGDGYVQSKASLVSEESQAGAAVMPAIVVEGDLFKSKAKYIVHQCNCVTWTAAHLAKDMFAKFPYADVYSPRKEGDYRDTPGDIIVKGNGQDERFVIAILGQVYPGRPRVSVANDQFDFRTRYFFEGLKKIAAIDGLESVAFPWGIGCGAAGNNWEKYHKLIDKLADHLGDKAKVYIYKLPGM